MLAGHGDTCLLRLRQENGQRVLGKCGGLNKNGPHRLIDLNAWSPGSGTI